MSRGYVISRARNKDIVFLAILVAGWVSISGVDFGCFSTDCRDCEALDEREEQVDFTLFLLLPVVTTRISSKTEMP